MRLNTLFTEEPIDFESRCRTRIKVGLGITVLGLLSLALFGLVGHQLAL